MSSGCDGTLENTSAAHSAFSFPFANSLNTDTRAEDAAHFFFGTHHAQVELYPGTITLNECMDMYYPDAGFEDFWNIENPYS